MSRLKDCFAGLKQQNRTALVPYVTAGDPQPGVTVPLMHVMVSAGANILELGVPFSDPMADGPVIQRASERALVNHVSLHDVLGMVREFRTRDNDTPVVLMGYLNPVEVMGYETFARAASDAGVDGLLTVDLPPEEGRELVELLKEHNIDPIFLLAPTTDDGRISTICASASGFVYYVSLKGVTGASNLDLDSVTQKLKQIGRLTDLPVGVGFGIKDASTAAKIANLADAVVIGSALVNRIEALADSPDEINKSISGLLVDIRQAMDS
ncbi:MAG: tryptophan synthase subunit alpha [Gammaproteobacteria bacterium]|nr:MAG: tryptophan synthase subunit alpha [Gammaproteobacteria bacterium]